MAALGWLPNLDFAASTADEVVIVVPSPVGGGTSEAFSRQRLRRLQIQQGILKDDDEILAVLIATGFFN